MKLSMLLVAAVVTVSAGGGGCANKPPQPAPAPTSTPPQAAKPAQPGADIKLPPPSAVTLSAVERKLDAALLELVRQTGEIKEPELAAWRAKHALPTAKARVGVDITCRTPQQADAVEKAVQAVGGEIVAKFENTVYARLAPASIMRIAEMADVWTVAASRKTVGRRP